MNDAPPILPQSGSQSTPPLNLHHSIREDSNYVAYPLKPDYLGNVSSNQGLSIAQIINPSSAHNTPPLPQSEPLGLYQLPAVAHLLPGASTSQNILGSSEIPQHIQSFPSHVHAEQSTWPLTDRTEANLLRHFIKNLAIWVSHFGRLSKVLADASQLDLCDPLQHFQTVVPQRAASSRILLNAIFALSARHLNKISDYDPYASNRYHDECLKYLIPMLNDASTISDQSIFAATIILRVLEEMDGQ